MQTSTHTSPLIGTDYPRTVVRIDGESHVTYLGHKDARCVDCEFRLGNTRRHPRDANGFAILHGGQRMIITE